jgi:hypothetical protein
MSEGQEKKQIVISDVLDMLQEGKEREEIRLHYGLSKRDLKLLFQHPSLKGKKTKVAPAFEIVDDTVKDNNDEIVIGEVVETNEEVASYDSPQSVSNTTQETAPEEEFDGLPVR